MPQFNHYICTLIKHRYPSGYLVSYRYIPIKWASDYYLGIFIAENVLRLLLRNTCATLLLVASNLRIMDNTSLRSSKPMNILLQNDEEIELKMKHNDERSVKNDDNNRIVDKSYGTQRLTSVTIYSEIQNTQIHPVTCYLEASSEPKNKRSRLKYLNIIIMVDFVLLLVVPWIFLCSVSTKCRKNMLSTGKQEVVFSSTIEAGLLNYNYTMTDESFNVTEMKSIFDNRRTTEMVDNTKSLHCTREYEFEGNIDIPFGAAELYYVSFINETTYLVILRQHSDRFKEVFKVVNDRVGLFLKSSVVRELIQVEYLTSQNMVYVLFHDRSHVYFYNKVVAKVSLKGIILQEFEFGDEIRTRSLFEGPRGKMYLVARYGVMELISQKYIIKYSSYFYFGIYLEKHNMFVLGHKDNIAGYYVNSSLAWQKPLKKPLVQFMDMLLTLSPCGNDALIVDNDSNILYSIDHTGEITPIFNVSDVKHGSRIRLVATHSRDNNVIALFKYIYYSPHILTLRRKKKCVCK